MELIAAIVLALLSGALITAYPILRWRLAAQQQQAQLQRQLDNLQTQLTALKQELAALKNTPPATQPPINLDPLSQIEQLANPHALTNSDSLESIVEQIAALPTGTPSDLFEADRKLLAISRLAAHGHPLPEIARRLSLPLGEVELLSSLRSR